MVLNYMQNTSIKRQGIPTASTSEVKWGCLKSLGSADAQYNVESVLNRFKRARGAENRKNKTKVRGSSIAAATASQELPRNPLYPSLSSVVIEQLTVLYNVMIADQPSPDGDLSSSEQNLIQEDTHTQITNEVQNFERDLVPICARDVLGARGTEARGWDLSWQCWYDDKTAYCKGVIDVSVGTGPQN
ncbi:hypothetical protein B0H14DRAFT_2594926 [Mycena olivaceomarginata]|nr:hypothetical protein B0H14DRAFT_2594926 [Mycena olivaceomarginata]